MLGHPAPAEWTRDAMPVLDEILRAKLPIRPDVFARWQREIRAEVLPQLAPPTINVLSGGHQIAAAVLSQAPRKGKTS